MVPLLMSDAAAGSPIPWKSESLLDLEAFHFTGILWWPEVLELKSLKCGSLLAEDEGA